MGKRLEKVNIEWSPNFAYAIGVIASDGHLKKNGIHISLNSKDEEMVVNLKNALNLKNKIGFYSPKDHRKGWYTIEFGDKTFYDFLQSIGINQSKSRNIKSVTVPNEYFADFLRGLFDGDGTFYSYWDKRWPNSLVFRMSFASASKKFVSWLQETLSSNYEVKGFIKKGDGVWNLNYVKGDSVTLYKTMYYKENLIFLKRKYKKIFRVLEKDPNLNFDAAVAQPGRAEA